MINVISQVASGRYLPAANPINVTINSTNAGNCNMRYICDIWINGIKVFRHKLFPDPSTGYAFFQTQRVIQDYIKNHKPVTAATKWIDSATELTAPTNLITVYFKYGEEYDNSVNCNGAVTTYENLLTSNTFYVYNAAIDYEDFPTYTDATYKMNWTATASSPTLTKFLTHAPSTQEVTYNESYYLEFLADTNPTIYTNGTTSYMVISFTINYKDGSVSGLEIPVSYLVPAKRRYRMFVGPADINRIFDQSYINQSVQSYSIQLTRKWYNGSSFVPVTISELKTFKIKAPGAFQTRIGFIGLLGSVEYFTFFHRNKKQLDINRSVFKKTLSSNKYGVWSYDVGERSDTIYDITAQETHSVNSYCSRQDSDWLTELWLSTEQWVEKSPDMLPFRTIIDTVGATSSTNFWLPSNHGLVVGDSFYTIPCNDPELAVYNNTVYTVVALIGENKVDVGLINPGISISGPYLRPIYTGESYPIGDGYIVKKAPVVRLPIICSDKTIEYKQKTTKPIEYSFNYMNAYSKTTLRG